MTEEPLQCYACGNHNQKKFSIIEKSEVWNLIRCSICNFEFWWPMTPEVAWSSRAEKQLIFDDAIFKILEERHTQSLGFLKTRKDVKKLLDVGCRGAAFVKECEKLGIESWGIDPEKDIIKCAKKFHGLKHLYPESIHAFVKHAPQPLFDAITIFDLFEHIGNPEELIRTAGHILHPHGFLILSVPNLNRFGGYNPLNKAPYHWTRWTKKTTRTFLEKNGFVLLKIQHIESSPRQFVDLLHGLKKGERSGGASAATKNKKTICVSYAKNSVLKQTLKILMRPFLKILNLLGKSHTILVIGEYRPKQS